MKERPVRHLAPLICLLAAILTGNASAAPDETPAPPKLALATFAGGCFWCMEGPFDGLEGVVRTTVGYTGGTTTGPTYEAVSAGGTGHAEAIEILFDPAKVSYEKLLYVFWRNVDPLQTDGQFCDIGDQYRAEIFYRDPEQKRLAEASKEALEKSGRFGSVPIAATIVEAGPFYPAEEYHQDYSKKNPAKYEFYRWSCGRDRRLNERWGVEAGGGH